jgi:hypothetical protein|tara:strand:- start:8404 stop:9399 length:996 start_codon:yes stop_codon:yes gene_type:complete
MWQKLIYLVLLCSTISAQSFFYSYIDPCNQTTIKESYSLQEDDSGGFQVTYYNRTRYFTFEQVLNGELEAWAESVYNDFEDLFPCAVRVAEEILSSVIASSAASQFSKTDDISVDAGQMNYAIQSTTRDSLTGDWITSFNSVYTSESFDGSRTHDGNFNFTDDLRKGSVTYGQGFKFKAKKQNVQINGTGLAFETFEGWDWLASISYAKSLQKPLAEAIVITGTYGNVSEYNFANISVVYGMNYPLKFRNVDLLISNYMAYTIMRYYEGNNSGERYLLLRSPIIMFPTISMDWKVGQAFKLNLGFSMGINTVVNDYGERSKTYSLLFGTYF